MKKFNKDKYLRKLKFKRFYRKYERYFYIGIPCLLIAILGIYFAYSKFTAIADTEVVRTTVGEFIQGDVVIKIYVNGEYSETAPQKNTGYKVDSIVCDNGAIGEWNNDDWGPTITNVTKRNKCNIYFTEKEKVKFGNIGIALDVYDRCPSLNDDGTVTVTGAEDTCGYLCKAKDAYGYSYYFRGNVTNNYVLFGGFYWRIIRMNGDGSVRVIYDGTSAHVNGESSEDRIIGRSEFNEYLHDNAHIGYMYGKFGGKYNTLSSSSYELAHANVNDSTIKTYVDTWYENNIKGTANEKYIVDNLFCNDRSFASNNSGKGYARIDTDYRWYNFADTSYNNKMMLTCPQQNDAFTVNDTSKGNGALTYGIGLLTADEAVLAGGWNTNNSNYYLYIGHPIYTLSPSNYKGGTASTVIISDLGKFSDDLVADEINGVRPVISLTSEVLAQGDGTTSNPFHLAS